MNISIEQYRVSIGLHNNIRFKSFKSKGITHGNQHTFAVIFDSLGKFLSAAGFCTKFLIVFIGILNYVLDIFQEHINSRNNHTTCCPHDNCSDQVDNKLFLFNPNSPHNEYRIIFSCIFYCMIFVTQETAQAMSFSNTDMLFRKIYCRLFLKKSFLGCCINIYSLWLLSLIY